jgi:hypothetical protein
MVQKVACLAEREAQIGEAQLDDLVTHPQPAQGQGRISAGRDD